jgi:hypothetical protein
MLRDHTTIICPLPGMGHCIREPCNFWDEGREECACDCFDTGGPGQADAPGTPDWPCVISYDEDYD